MQRNPEELYELGPAAPDTAGAPMLHYLEGFIDAGTAGRLLAEHLLRTFSHETVARCYPKLVAARRQSYEALAHCTLAVAELHTLPEADAAGDGGEAFLEKIQSQLAKKTGRANGV